MMIYILVILLRRLRSRVSVGRGERALDEGAEKETLTLWNAGDDGVGECEKSASVSGSIFL